MLDFIHRLDSHLGQSTLGGRTERQLTTKLFLWSSPAKEMPVESSMKYDTCDISIFLFCQYLRISPPATPKMHALHERIYAPMGYH